MVDRRHYQQQPIQFALSEAQYIDNSNSNNSARIHYCHRTRHCQLTVLSTAAIPIVDRTYRLHPPIIDNINHHIDRTTQHRQQQRDNEDKLTQQHGIDNTTSTTRHGIVHDNTNTTRH
jgi:hypothetical protein